MAAMSPEDLAAQSTPTDASPHPQPCDPRQNEFQNSEPNPDPPPPYPSPQRRQRARRSRRLPTIATHPHQAHISSSESYSDREHEHDHTPSSESSPRISASMSYPGVERDDNDDEDATESTPFLQRTRTGRPRGFSAVSHAGSMAPLAAPSLAQTCLSLFCTDDDDDDNWRNGGARMNVRSFLMMQEDREEPESAGGRGRRGSAESWRRYFRPMGKAAYYRALVHLLLVNFPYALLAWVYLFVLTVAGTTLLMALPLGAILCFFNLLGARAFARGELALQTRFHSPLSYPAPYPPRPIFRRLRQPTAAELEAGIAAAPGDLVPERSFYRNAYAMFTDPTSYQALFYFLVIKPSITIMITLLLLIIGIPAFLLVLPAPAVLRAVRRLGVWQGNVAVEGLYLAVR